MCVVWLYRNANRRDGTTPNKWIWFQWASIYAGFGQFWESKSYYNIWILRLLIGDSCWLYVQQCNYILQLLPLASLGCSKTSILCFYRRIFFINNLFLIWNTVLMVIVVLWAVSIFFTTVFQCRDPAMLWSTFEYERTNCVETIPFYYAVSISGFITDIMILASPLPIIYKLHLPLRNRIAIAGIFLLGAMYVWIYSMCKHMMGHLILTGAVFVAQELDALWPLSTLAMAISLT